MFKQFEFTNEKLSAQTMDYDEPMDLISWTTSPNISNLTKYIPNIRMDESIDLNELDAFSCPTVKSENTKAKDSLSKTLQLLDEAKHVCTELHDQLNDKEVYYNQREQELQTLHRCELEKAQATLTEFQQLANEQQSALQAQLSDKDADNKRALECYTLEMENKFAQKQQQYSELEARELDLQKRLSATELQNSTVHTQLASLESQLLSSQQTACEREQELNAHLKLITKELESLREIKDQSERDYREKLNLSQDEISVLRNSRKSLTEKLDKVNGTSPRNSSNSSAEISRLQSEADSLRCVLEIKQKEISKLTKHNEELMRDADERTALMAKISLLESQNEMLQSEVAIKTEKEKDFQRQMHEVKKAFSNENNKRQRLSCTNEQLQYMLKQRAEQIQLLESKLSNSHDSSYNRSQCFNETSLLNSSIISRESTSPSASPVIKGVIEKTDSVSWVLEMDDETAEAAVSKIVKRAGSFRSMERSGCSARRQLSLSGTIGGSGSANSSMNGSPGPNPLSQSMSAASVIHQHSNCESTPEGTPQHKGHTRTRSKSVSIKITEPSPQSGKKYSRQSSANGSVSSRKSECNTNWKTSNFSSPYGGMRPRSSTLKCRQTPEPNEEDKEQQDDEELFRRSSSSKLITCDTSALNKGERLEIHSLPSHSSLHDLKSQQQQQIQESAGEAMVSGTNSEDEGCSAYSDEMASSESTSSGNTQTGSSSSLNLLKNSHMTFEEMRLMDKISHSLNGTPMEGSWSEDVEGFVQATHEESEA